MIRPNITILQEDDNPDKNPTRYYLLLNSFMLEHFSKISPYVKSIAAIFPFPYFWKQLFMLLVATTKSFGRDFTYSIGYGRKLTWEFSSIVYINVLNSKGFLSSSNFLRHW